MASQCWHREACRLLMHTHDADAQQWNASVASLMLSYGICGQVRRVEVLREPFTHSKSTQLNTRLASDERCCHLLAMV